MSAPTFDTMASSVYVADTQPAISINSLPITSGGAGLSISSIASGINSSYAPVGEEYIAKTITGQMITAEIILPEIDVEKMKDTHGKDGFKYEIKKMLCEKMAEKIYKEGKFDFGMQQNFTDFTYSFRARIFVTPNDQTQVVRQVLEK